MCTFKEKPFILPNVTTCTSHKIIFFRLSLVFPRTSFFAKTQKALRFDALIEKRVFTYLQAQKSQHRAEQLNPLDLTCGGDQSTDADRSRGCPRASLVTDRVGEIGRVRGCSVKDHRIAKLPNPPCRKHNQRRSPLA
jgi:hypothetical protein